MGYLHANTCFSVAQDAQDAFYSSQTPNFYQSSGKNYLVQFEKDPISASWFVKTYEIRPNGMNSLISTNPTPTMQFPTCDPMEPFYQGVDFGYLLLIPLVLAWCFVAVAKVMR